MHSLLQDLRYSFRQLANAPGFSLAAIVTLALAIGATTAIFSLVEGVLLRPLPFKDPARLVFLGDILEGVTHAEDGAPGVTAPGALIYMRGTHSFDGMGVVRATTYELSSASNAAQINAARLTAGLFPTLGVSPIIGRVFSQQDETNDEPVVVLSYETWHSRFNADPQILNRKILLDRKPYQIIGVMPRDFEFPLVPGHLNRCELWLPMHFSNAELTSGAGNWGYSLIARLKPNVTPAQAENEAQPAAHEIMRSFPPALSNRRLHAAVRPMDQITVAAAKPLVRTLFLAVIVVLFIACANLAGLLLLRVLRRRREFSVRLAIGAGKLAVVRQPILEALILSTCGGLIGLLLAAVTLHVGLTSLPEDLPRIGSIKLDATVILVSLGLALLTGLVCGIIPGLVIARTEIADALKAGGRSSTGSVGHARLRSALVIAELAVALVLLTASGLLLRSFENMRAVSLGFNEAHTLTASYGLPRQQYSTQASVDAFNQSLRSRLEQLPGVQAVGMTSLLPASGLTFLGVFTPEGYIPPKGIHLNIAWIPEVSGNYFAAQGIPILRGRDFTPADHAPGAPLVTIVNRSLAEHYWPGQSPIGKRVHRGPAEAKLPWITIVGEIEGVKQFADQPAQQEFYTPAEQSKAIVGSFAPPNMLTGVAGSVVVRSTIPPENLIQSLRSIVNNLDPQLPLTDVASMDQIVTDGQASRRFNTVVISAFAAVAVFLAILGIYSVIAYSAAARTSEIAVRLALGSQRAGVMRLILASAAKLGIAGCAIGVLVAVFTTRLLSSFLFGVSPLDPTVLAIAAIALFALVLAASAIPARRAGATEPLQALRSE